MKGLLLSVILIVFLAWTATLNWSCQSNPPSGTTFPQAITYLTFPTATPCGYPGATCTPTPTPPPVCQATPIAVGTAVIASTTFFGNKYVSTCRGGTAPDVSYTFTLASSRTVTISTCNPGTNYDTVLAVLSSCNPVTEIACNDDGGCGGLGLQSVITGTLPAGTYWIVVDGFSGASGQYELSLR